LSMRTERLCGERNPVSLLGDGEKFLERKSKRDETFLKKLGKGPLFNLLNTAHLDVKIFLFDFKKGTKGEEKGSRKGVSLNRCHHFSLLPVGL